VIVAAAAFEDQLAEEGRLRSWGKGDLIDRKGGLKGGCINCGISKGWKGRWGRSIDEEETDDDLIEEENKMRSHGGMSRSNGGSLGGKSSGRKGRTMEEDDIEAEENKMRSHGGKSGSNGGKSNSGRKGRTMEEEDLETEESKMSIRSHGVHLGGNKKMGLKQIVSRGKW